MTTSPLRALPALLSTLFVLPVAAQDPATLKREIETALIRAAESGALGEGSQATTLQDEARVRYELGAVVDLRSAGPGLPVLAVTPGAAASRLDLRPGDRLLAVNGRPVGSSAESLQQAIDAGNGRLAAQWLRNGKPMAATDRADAVAVPAFRLLVGGEPATGCGFVSDKQGVVPKNQGIFRAEITRIDGRSTPLAGNFEYRLPVGRHVLRVAEHIDRNRLSVGQATQISLTTRRMTGTQQYKTLVVDVKPNTTYRIGVRFFKDKLDNDSIRRNAYWEPEVWETRAQACR